MASDDSNKEKMLQREIKDMISTLTQRLTDLRSVHKSSSSHDTHEDDSAVKIVTLAGSNIGVTMRADLDEMPETLVGFPGDQDMMNTYVNSNFQAVNNSVMMGGSCTSEDPGVHLEFVEELDFDAHEEHGHGKKGKKKKKEKSDPKDNITNKSHSDSEP